MPYRHREQRQGQRQVDSCEFMSSMVYLAIFAYTVRPCVNPSPSRTKTKAKTTEIPKF